MALEEWLARYPEFELADDAAVTWSGGQVRGPRTIPIRVPQFQADPFRVGPANTPGRNVSCIIELDRLLFIA